MKLTGHQEENKKEKEKQTKKTPCICVNICSLLKVLYEMQMLKTLKMFAVPLSPQDSNCPNSDRIRKGRSEKCQGVFLFLHQPFKPFVVFKCSSMIADPYP